MSPIEIWGKYTWIFLHTLVSKINPEYYNRVGLQAITLIKSICSNLPCPECTGHAMQFWKTVDVSRIRTKDDLVNLIFYFHNLVNKRKDKPIQDDTILDQYKTMNLAIVYNNFRQAFSTRGDVVNLAQSLHRTLVLNNTKKWIIENKMFLIQ